MYTGKNSATTKSLFSSNQLVFTSSQLTPSIEAEPTTPRQNNNNSCEKHTVESGDTLWGIAKRSLGNGSRYQEIIDSNTDEYPSLANSSNLSTGWVLKISCDKEQSKKQTEAENVDTNADTNIDTTAPQGGYELNVKVTDDNKKPVEGATVTIHSVVQTTTTNKDGIAEFKNVESGQHRVLIAYDNFEGEQSINLTGDVKKFDLTVTVQPKNVLLSPLVLAIIGILSLIIIVLAIVIIRARRRIKGLDIKQQTN
jgi:LysM repeat protein